MMLCEHEEPLKLLWNPLTELKMIEEEVQCTVQSAKHEEWVNPLFNLKSREKKTPRDPKKQKGNGWW